MKFGGYTITYKTISKNKRADGSIRALAELKGTIEIGIDIDTWTWRGDWIAEKVLKDKKNEYRLSAVKNNYISSNPETNRVELVFTTRW